MFEIDTTLSGTPRYDVFDGLEDDHTESPVYFRTAEGRPITLADIMQQWDEWAREATTRWLNEPSPLLGLIDKKARAMAEPGSNTYYTTLPASLRPR